MTSESSTVTKDKLVADLKILIADSEELLRASAGDRKSTRLNSSHIQKSRMPSSA